MMRNRKLSLSVFLIFSIFVFLNTGFNGEANNERGSLLDDNKDFDSINAASPQENYVTSDGVSTSERSMRTGKGDEGSLLRTDSDSVVEAILYCSGAPRHGSESLLNDASAHENGWPSDYYTVAYESNCNGDYPISSDELIPKLIKLGKDGSSLAWLRLSFLYENGSPERVTYLGKALNAGSHLAAIYLMENYLHSHRKQDAESVENLVMWGRANLKGKDMASLQVLYEEYRNMLSLKCQKNFEEC